MRTIEYSYVDCRSALSKSRLPGLDYSLNPYVGCEHGCIYCYGRSFLRDKSLVSSWGSFSRAKKNVVDVLRRELRKKRRGIVGVSTITDPYQPFEARTELTRKCLETLSENGFHISIQTKSSLILRDIDIIRPGGFDVGVTITTMNSELAKKIEPKASAPDARSKVIEEFSSRDVETWIFLGPIIPGINDDLDSIKEVMEIAKRNRSRLLYDKLNLRPYVLDSVRKFLEKEKPEISEELPKLLDTKSKYVKEIKIKVESTCRRLGVACEPAFPMSS